MQTSPSITAMFHKNTHPSSVFHPTLSPYPSWMLKWGMVLLWVMGLLGGGHLLAKGDEKGPFSLMKDGKATSVMVLKKDASETLRFGAEELANYLGKIADGTAPKIVEEAPADAYPIYLGTIEDASLVKQAGIDPKKLEKEGFAISAKEDGLYLIGQNQLSALYAAYEILKKYGGIRWVVPTDDGEYFTVRKSIEVPGQLTYHNPYMQARVINGNNVGGSGENSWLWMIRNNMQPEGHFYLRGDKERALQKKLQVKQSYGGHILGYLLTGWRYRYADKTTEADYEDLLTELFEKHPEYFPEIDGKRIPLKGHGYQPCTSNPEVIQIMADNLLLLLEQREMLENARFTLGNMDGTGWCQCAECVKLDPPEERAIGSVATRYWTMVNAVTEKAIAKNPKVKEVLGGWAYQNFQNRPEHLKIDPNLYILLSFNRECYKHRLTDPNCPTNKKFMEYYKKWGELPNFTYNRDEIGAGAAVFYTPTERVIYENLGDYPSFNLKGGQFCVPAYDSHTTIPNLVSRRWNDLWYSMWQSVYIDAVFSWDYNQDYDKIYEEINSLFYGKAWEGGMKEFRALLTKYFRESSGCSGWGHGAAIGRYLDTPGSEEKLLSLLDNAEKAAADDPRALAHVQRDKRIFNEVWVAARKQYETGLREMRAYRQKAPIQIDGVLDEADWKAADVINNFMKFVDREGPDASKKMDVQTYFRVVYEPENVYIAIECMEPHPELLKHSLKEGDHDAQKIWGDDKVELFFQFPDMANQYYHVVITSGGAFYDALSDGTSHDKTKDLKPEIKVRVLKDRWVAEMRFPTGPIGMKAFDNQTWKINVGRSRILTDGTKEQSSWANGAFHNVDNFGTITFVPEQHVNMRDISPWKNPSFDDVVKVSEKSPENYHNWNLLDDLFPNHWGLVGPTGTLEMKLHEDSKTNYYMEVTGPSYIWQAFNPTYAPTGTEMQVNFRARGDGIVRLNYVRRAKKDLATPGWGPVVGQDTFLTLPIQSDTWEYYKGTFEKDDTDAVFVGFYVDKGIVMIDDCVVSPVAEENGQASDK